MKRRRVSNKKLKCMRSKKLDKIIIATREISMLQLVVIGKKGQPEICSVRPQSIIGGLNMILINIPILNRFLV